MKVREGMSMRFLIAVLLLGLAACEDNIQKTLKSSNAAVEVGLLFKVDGCSVYRFSDAGYYRYFVRCDGSAEVSTEFSDELCTSDGKTTTCTETPVSIKTAKGRK